MLFNITANFLCLSSTLQSPLLTCTKSSSSYLIENCRFNKYFNNFYRSSSSSLVKERIEIRKSQFSNFITTVLSLTPDYYQMTIEERIFITNQTDGISSLTIIDCTFKNIISDERGAAIRIAKHIPLVLNDTRFNNCISRYEAAILFVLIGEKTWSLEPININRCYVDSCYSTGQYFVIKDDYSDKYPSVLIHDYLGFLLTSIESNINSFTALNCQENESPKKKFGAYIHHHANTFTIQHFNCTNKNKIDSSQIIFTQSHKQASNVLYVIATGQVGNSLIEIKDIQSSDQLTFQNIDIYNSTLLTEEPVTVGSKTEYVKSECGIINFGGDYSGSIVFIYCHFFNIYTDDKSIEPVLAYSSNGRLPIFANCFTNVESIANNRGLTFTTPFEPSLNLPTLTPTVSDVEILPQTSNPETTEQIEINDKNDKNNTKNIIVVSVSIFASIVVTVIALVISRYYLYRNINLIDETDDSTFNRDLSDAINANSNITPGSEENYVE